MWQSIVTFLSFYLYTMFCRTNVFRKKIATQILPPWQILSNKSLSDKSRDTIIPLSQLLSNKCLSNKSVDKIFSTFASKMQKSLSSCCADNCKRTLSDEWTFWMKKIDFRFFWIFAQRVFKRASQQIEQRCQYGLSKLNHLEWNKIQVNNLYAVDPNVATLWQS